MPIDGINCDIRRWFLGCIILMNMVRPEGALVQARSNSDVQVNIIFINGICVYKILLRGALNNVILKR